MAKKMRAKREVVKKDGKLAEVTTVYDEKGDILHKIMSPFRVEFQLKDVLQVILGASILAIPVAFTEETWVMGATLPMQNVLGLMALSFIFLSTFVYYTYHRTGGVHHHLLEFMKRVVGTYVLSFMVVALILTLIEQSPWMAEPLKAFKVTVIVTLPASMSAVLADSIK